MENFLERLVREIYEADDYIVLDNIQVPKLKGGFLEFDGVAIKGPEIIWLESSSSASKVPEVEKVIEKKLEKKKALIEQLKKLLKKQDVKIKEIHYYFEGLSQKPREETRNLIERCKEKSPSVIILGMRDLLKKAEDILDKLPPDRTVPMKMGYLKLIQACRKYYKTTR